ncbi:MAG: hypothetical protein QNJ37_03145 [Crocosphaera sp.]|nr:hypothetical protein [Crocosphaera sp.]
MPKVLTTSSTVLCGELVPGSLHGGTVGIESSAQLKVGGSSVLLKSGLEGKSISGCQNAPPPSSKIACSSVTQVMAGEATKLKVEGKSVMLDSLLVGTTNGTPPGSLKVTTVQSKLTAI